MTKMMLSAPLVGAAVNVPATVKTHLGAQPRYVGKMHGRMVVWFEADDMAPIVKRKVYAVGTGWPVAIPDLDSDKVLEYVNTYQDGVYVTHYFIDPEEYDE